MEERILETGCQLTRTFNQSASTHSITHTQRLMEKGYRELYFEADYYWGMVNIDKATIVQNTEGDVDVIECPNKVTLQRELVKMRDFMVEQGSRVGQVNETIRDVEGMI